MLFFSTRVVTTDVLTQLQMWEFLMIICEKEPAHPLD